MRILNMFKIKYSTNFYILNENIIEAKYFDIIFCSSKQYALEQSKQNKDILFARKNIFYNQEIVKANTCLLLLITEYILKITNQYVYKIL